MVDGETRDYMKKKMKWRKLALALALAVSCMPQSMKAQEVVEPPKLLQLLCIGSATSHDLPSSLFGAARLYFHRPAINSMQATT